MSAITDLGDWRFQKKMDLWDNVNEEIDQEVRQALMDIVTRHAHDFDTCDTVEKDRTQIVTHVVIDWAIINALLLGKSAVNPPLSGETFIEHVRDLDDEFKDRHLVRFRSDV